MFISEPRTPEQINAVALTLYIDELTRRLDTKDFEEDPITRSPSPPPEYDRNGLRTNTREQRKIQELETERTLAVIKALNTIPRYVPPATMTRLTKIQHKVFLPVREYPHINFIGLLLGPRGNALRNMEAQSGARIGIRGRGSVKEGGRSAAASSNEDLHCVVQASSQASIDKAEELINEVVRTAVDTPEHKNDFKRLQLRELAELNGTLRDFENELCGFCHEPGHRKYDCPAKKLAECRQCGAAGHFEKECRKWEDGEDAAQSFLDDINDEEETTNTLNGENGVASHPSVQNTPAPALHSAETSQVSLQNSHSETSQSAETSQTLQPPEPLQAAQIKLAPPPKFTLNKPPPKPFLQPK